MNNKKGDKKMTYRDGIPDDQKREMLLNLFEIKPEMCYFEYLAVRKSAGDDFIKLT